MQTVRKDRLSLKFEIPHGRQEFKSIPFTLNEESPMRASQIFMIALLGGVLYLLFSEHARTEDSDTENGGLQAAKAYVPRGAGLEWTEEGDLTFSLRFPSSSHSPQRSRRPEADISEREETRSNPYHRVPD
jgi:hypothetical protein